ncbi:Peptidyl-prolyl cis-trans isomerase 11 [Bonamia ostreae]|uniref:Peptidyl-prolyl cis-trans isomerase n=1 Tax=Bonamia ostreae TaxID=126728 RepID=A0ABV2AGW5_9EUKA
MTILSDRYELTHTENPVVFFDIKIGDHEAGRIVVELFKNSVPKTAENFRQFCVGKMKLHGEPVGYKKTFFHRVIKGFMIQGGDFINNDGTGSLSIYGSNFADESFENKHTNSGLLSMANSGKDSNGCQFFITCDRANWLDNKHVVFGRVVSGMLTVRKIENIPVDSSNRPKIDCVIVECGEM